MRLPHLCCLNEAATIMFPQIFNEATLFSLNQAIIEANLTRLLQLASLTLFFTGVGYPPL